MNSKVQQNLELIFMRGKCPPALLLATAGLHNIIGKEVLMLSRMVLNLVRSTALEWSDCEVTVGLDRYSYYGQ